MDFQKVPPYRHYLLDSERWWRHLPHRGEHIQGSGLSFYMHFHIRGNNKNYDHNNPRDNEGNENGTDASHNEKEENGLSTLHSLLEQLEKSLLTLESEVSLFRQDSHSFDELSKSLFEEIKACVCKQVVNPFLPTLSAACFVSPINLPLTSILNIYSRNINRDQLVRPPESKV